MLMHLIIECSIIVKLIKNYIMLNQIKEKILMYLFYSIGILLLMFAFKYDSIVLKFAGIIFGGILTVTNAIKVIYYFYLDGKFNYKKIPTGLNLFEKKTRKVDVYRLSSNLFLYGLVLAVASLLLAFKSDKSKTETIELGTTDYSEIDEIFAPPPTRKSVPPPPEIPEVKPPTSEQIEVVEDYKEPEKIEDIPVFKDKEVTEIDFTGEESSFEIPDIIDDIKNDFEKAKKAVELEEPPIIFIAQNMPQFIGGEKALLSFLYSNINYPTIAKENRIEGTVYLYFVIDEKGNVVQSKIVRDIGGGCGKEALRVINSMPKWKPGTNQGKPVKVAFNIPIKFKLD